MITICDALVSLRYGAEWNCRGATYADIEWLDEVQLVPTEAELIAEVSRLSTLPSPSFVQFVGLVRFTVSGNSVTVTADTIDISAVLRVSAGRYRVYTQASSSSTLLPKITVLDPAVRSGRISARTAAYVEVRVVDGANVAAEAAEVILELSRIVTS